MGAGVTAVGDRFADNANSTTLPGYARFDARAGYRWQQRQMALDAPGSSWTAMFQVEFGI